MEKYIIEIKKSDSYQETDYRYEGSDGKLYTSQYGLPEGVTAKRIAYETGETKWNDSQIYRQEVDAAEIKKIDEARVNPTWLMNIIKAVNEL